MRGDEVADEIDLFDVSRAGLHNQIMNVRSDCIASALGEQNRKWHVLHDFEDVRRGTVAARQNNSRQTSPLRTEKRGCSRKQNVFTVAGRDDQDAALEITHRVM